MNWVWTNKGKKIQVKDIKTFQIKCCRDNNDFVIIITEYNNEEHTLCFHDPETESPREFFTYYQDAEKVIDIVTSD